MNEQSQHDARMPYEEPEILGTYKREELEEAVMPEGQQGGGCGCGGGSVLPN